MRDLLGIARALYVAERDELVRGELTAIGTRLPPDRLGGKAAYRRAEEATARLCAVVSGDVERLVRAAAGRVRRG